MIDIAMTATLRPKIHKEVFESLKENLIVNDDLRLVLNIDSIGNKKIKQEKVLENIQNHFSNIGSDIIYNISNNPNFFKALYGVGSNTSTNFVLQGEDDWILGKKLYLDDFIAIMKKKNIDVFGFYCKKKNREEQTLHTQYISEKKYDYISIKKPLPFLTPSILTQRYLNPVTNLMKDSKNFTKPIQFIKGNAPFRQLVMKELNCVKYLDGNFQNNANRDLLIDIGRKGKKGKYIRFRN